EFWFRRVMNQLGTSKEGDFSGGGHGHAIQWEALGYLSGKAFGTAAMALVGQNLGARRPDRAAKCGWTALWLGGGFMSLMGLVFFTLAVPMFRLFSPGEHQQRVIEYGVPVLR